MNSTAKPKTLWGIAPSTLHLAKNAVAGFGGLAILAMVLLSFTDWYTSKTTLLVGGLAGTVGAALALLEGSSASKE